jgi:cell fate regulator YaaT (PSP1 superfamily)
MQPEELLGTTPDSFEIEFKGGRTALFANPRNIPFRIGDFAVVDVERGHDIGKVIREGSAVSKKLRSKGIQGPILRRATSKDVATMWSLREKETEAHRTCQQCIAKQGLPMKLVDVEWQFDSNKIRFYFTSDRRVDFRKLVRDLASIFKSRIEMRQIGVRDEARRLGGYGRCGRYYCCRGVINDFDPVTLKMVKEQHLAPGSPKISGGCGRLMCCLRYERDFYKEASRDYPKLGTRIEMGEGRGKGKVTGVDIFHGRVTLSDKEGVTTVVAIEDFKKGRITDVGADEARTALDDYWKDIEGGGGEKKPEEQGERNKQGKQQRRENEEGKNAG